MSNLKKHSLRMLLAHNIRTVRTDKGFSQETLAELCELHRTYISSVERGERNISVDNIERIATALDVDATKLMSENKK